MTSRIFGTDLSSDILLSSSHTMLELGWGLQGRGLQSSNSDVECQFDGRLVGALQGGASFENHTEREANIISAYFAEAQFVKFTQEDRIVVDLENAHSHTVIDSYVDSSAQRQREVGRT